MTDQYTIFLDESGWRLGVFTDGRARVESLDVAPASPAADDAAGPGDLDASEPDSDGVEARAEAACRRLAELGYNAQPLVLAVPSAWCLCAGISTTNLESGNRRQALAFRFEEHLPISAEDMVADYHEFGDETALAVAADLARLRQVVDAFESRGGAVGYICPVALLVAAEVVGDVGDADALLINSGGWDNDPATTGYDLIEIRRGEPVQWWWFADDDEALVERVGELAAEQDRTLDIALLGEADSPRALLDRVGRVKPRPRDVALYEAAARCAGRASRDGQTPWINLRCDALAMPRRFEVYRRPAFALAAAVALLLLCITAVAQWRAAAYAQIARDVEQKQIDLFRDAFEDKAVPPANLILSRMLSARKELAGIGGRGSGVEDAVARASALDHLRAALKALPSDLRYRILDLSIQPDMIRIDGQARSHVEAEQIAVALARSGHFDVQPPKTKALADRGVSFLFLAKPIDNPQDAP